MAKDPADAQANEDEVLRRMLSTPPKPHKPSTGEKRAARKRNEKPRDE